MYFRIDYRSAMLAVPILLKACLIHAQDEGPLLTLKDAVNQALKINPEINILKAKLESKSIGWKMATGLSTPEIGYVREGISSIDPIPFQEQRFTFQQELDFPLTSYYRLKKIAGEKEALQLELEALIREVSTGVKSRYVEIIYASHIRKLRADSYDLSKGLNEAVLMRVESGVGTYIDQLASEIRLVSSENDQYEAERLYHEARYRLFSYIGTNPDQQRYDIRFSDTLSTRDELIEQEIAVYSLDEQPLYKSAAASLSAAGFGLREARSGFLPSVRLGYLGQDFGTGYHFSGFETGLRIPVWGMLEQSGQVRQAKAVLTEKNWNLKAVELNIKEKIELAWHSYDNSQITIQLYRTQLKEKSEKLLALTSEAYRLGQIDILKLIEAQQMYLESQEKYLNALRDYYLRLIELEQYVGEELVF